MLAGGNRRFHYPYISCAQCGPRCYTIMEVLPYDRERTTMSGLPCVPIAAGSMLTGRSAAVATARLWLS